MLMFLFRETKAQHLFEKETSEIKYPQWQDGTFASDFNIGMHSYIPLLTIPSMYIRSREYIP